MENKTKEHNVLKFFMPLLACTYGLLLSFGCASVMMSEFYLGRELLSKGLEIIAIVLTVFIIKKPLSAMFPHMREYPLTLPRHRSAQFVASLIPLWFMIKQGLIYWVSGGAGSVELEPLVYTRQELLQDLIPCISAVLLAPVYEELCFRHLAIAPFRKK